MPSTQITRKTENIKCRMGFKIKKGKKELFLRCVKRPFLAARWKLLDFAIRKTLILNSLLGRNKYFNQFVELFSAYSDKGTNHSVYC